ncbi:hypothetical protein [uncultured Mediterranean phage uvMED]|nr:hypothetical protein [uncultured Mediterranean phage uvMED]
MTNYQNALDHIAKAKTRGDLSRCRSAFDRMYNAGRLTERELRVLKGWLHQKGIELGHANT